MFFWWLATTLDVHVAVQWSCDTVPASAQHALDQLGDDPHEVSIVTALRSAVQEKDAEATAAISFLHGCPAEQRPMVWRAMLTPSRTAEDEQTLKERRLAYQELRSKMLEELHQEDNLFEGESLVDQRSISNKRAPLG
eukprot:symbB.v1.2.038329.t1/scaffold5923.1/size26809/2